MGRLQLLLVVGGFAVALSACPGDGRESVVASHGCSDGVENGDETGVDCGGDDCAPCGVSQGCVTASDCASGVCKAQVCACPSGFADDGAGACADVDECAADLDDCDADAACANTDGGFVCACSDGFSGDGTTCTPCGAGRWGAGCAKACAGNATCFGDITCDPRTGAVTGCSWCGAGYWGATCADACDDDACAGELSCDQDTGATTTCSACATGYHGARCDEACPQGHCTGAVACDQDTGAATACDACEAGYYGAGCEHACDPGDCAGAVTCDKATGAVTGCTGCAAGYWGPGCADACPQGDCTGTVTCDQTSGEAMSCEACAAGYYGAACADACAQGDCVGTVTCDKTSGATLSCAGCGVGYHGPTCAETCEDAACVGAITCDQTTGAATACAGCANGYHGAACGDACPQGHCADTVTCDQATGAAIACTGCEPGYRGPTCADACAQGSCVGTVTCAQDTGAAVSCDACTAGYHGPTCQQTCAQGHCTGTVTCDQDTGAATSCTGCVAGYHGDTCADACDQGHCTGTVACEQATGAAQSCTGCEPGFYGPTCQLTCDPGDCSGTVTCDQATGAITGCSGCPAGLWGDTCSNSCAQGDCTGTVTCDQDTGAAISCTGCAPGHHGATCAEDCAQGDCVGAVACDQTTGAAQSCTGCNPGHYGATCAEDCAQGDCTGAVTCDQATGAAQSCTGCTPGHYGATCADTCVQGDCTGTVTCDQATGAAQSCTGCTPGHHGASCADACPQGHCTGTVTCDQATGVAQTCTGCEAGYTGPTCADSCPQGHCAGTVTCDQTTGAAETCAGCEAGYWGPTCGDTCDLGHCAGAVTCDQATGQLTSCESCAGDWAGPTCGWWNPAWTDRVPVALTVTDAPAGAAEVQLPVDVDAICYGQALPPIVYSYHFDGDGDAIASRDGHGGFAPLTHGGARVPGVEGEALHLDGGAWVDLQDTAPTGDAFTAAAWVKLDAIPTTSAGPGVVSAWKDAEIYELRVTGDPSVCDVNPGGYGARFMTQVHPVDAGEPNLCSTTELLPNHWYHLALTFDGQVERLYVNGALEASYDYGAALALRHLGADVRLGTNRDLSDFLEGAVDGLVLLDGALDGAGVEALMRPRCRRDLADLRFYDRDAQALLPTWTESDGRVWVRVPVDIGDHAVDLYFGNPLAEDITDGAAVFELFDDFEGALDDDRWIPNDACPEPVVTRWGKARASSACATLTSVAGFGATPLTVAVDVTRLGGSTTCRDAAAEWLGVPVAASVGLNSAGSDGVGVGASGCATGAFLSSYSFDVGTLALAQTPAGGTFFGRWTPLGDGAATAGPFTAAGDKGALRLHLVGDDAAPVWLDDVRVYVPTTATVGFGDDAGCADALGVACCGHSDCSADEACQDAACVPRYRWVDLGPRDQQPISVTTCSSYFEDMAVCDGALVGERVHVADAASGINYRVIGAGGTFDTLPGGKGSTASVSADGLTLTWGGQSGGCTGQHMELVDLTAVWVCQAVYCDLDHECVSGVCADHACQDPTCDDGVHNGYESDIDCGGDCDACPIVDVRAGQSVLDSDAAATITFELSAPVGWPVAFDFATADSSAQAGVHYVATQGTGVFAPGEQIATAAVPLLHGPPTLSPTDDDKLFRITVTDVRGGDVGSARTVALRDSAFRVLGAAASDQILLARGSARRDLDGDEERDLVVSSVNGDTTGVSAGLVYVLVGDPAWPGGQVDLANLTFDGMAAFGIDRTYRYYDQVGVGDVDGDGLGDVLTRSSSNVYEIVFGGAQPYAPLYTPSTAGVATLTGSGFSNGIYYVAPFDFDGDGFDDVFVGGSNSTVYGGTGRGLAAWRGRETWSASQGPDLFTTMAIGHCGVSSRSNSASVGGPGDFDNDGYLDLTAGNGCSNDGQVIPFRAYVVFGNAAFTLPTSLSAVDGTDGFRLTGGGTRGPRPNGQHGDFNGDGIDDLMVHDVIGSGAQHVVYGGQASWAASTVLAGDHPASYGFRVDGGGIWTPFGGGAGFGDVDGDGFDDLVFPRSGSTGLWILWGRPGLGGTVSLASEPDALALPGVGDLAEAENVLVSDVDGDGLGDLVVSYPSGDVAGRTNSGVGLVVFGARLSPGHNPELVRGTPDEDVLAGTAAADAIVAGRGDDIVGGIGAGDVVYGGQGDDLVIVGSLDVVRVDGGAGADTLALAAPGLVLDLRATGRVKVHDFEVFDLTAAGSQTIALNAGDASAMSASRELWIDGDASDGVNLDGDWTNTGDADMDGRDAWVHANLTVHVGSDVLVEAFLPGSSISLDPAHVDEGVPNAVVGTLSTDDPDTPPANIVYTLVAGDGDDDNDLFVIDGATVLVGATALDYETATTLSIRVQADDGTTVWATALTVTVNDVGCNVAGECPVTVLLSSHAWTTCVVDGTSSACWGRNSHLSTGQPGVSNSFVPYLHPSLPATQQAAAGIHGSCARAGGAIYCWGSGFSGTVTPSQIGGVSGAVEVEVGDFHACALSDQGVVSCWGQNTLGQRGGHGLTGVRDVGVNDHHACALMDDGTIKCWGRNNNGQLGKGSASGTSCGTGGDVCESSPVTVSGITTAEALFVGHNAACARLTGGAIKCWGSNSAGQLGTGATSGNKYGPVDAAALPAGIVQLALGSGHACGLTDNAEVYCWGAQASGRIGNGQTSGTMLTPYKVSLPQATEVAVGHDHSCARLLNGEVWCWGQDSYGQCGNGDEGAATQLVPVKVSGIP